MEIVKFPKCAFDIVYAGFSTIYFSATTSSLSAFKMSMKKITQVTLLFTWRINGVFIASESW